NPSTALALLQPQTANPVPPAQGILVVNMIPLAFSGEIRNDSEPFLAVHPKEQIMLASAFTISPNPGGNAPVFVSVDGGASWAMNFTLPSAQAVSDQTYSFGGGTQLYGAIITRPGLSVPILSTNDPQLGSVMQVISDLSALPVGGSLQ